MARTLGHYLGRMRRWSLPLFIVLVSACGAPPPISAPLTMNAPSASAVPKPSATVPTAEVATVDPAPAWKPPPAPEGLIRELAKASADRREQILDELTARHGGAALVAALPALDDKAVEARWAWRRRVFDAIDRCGDPRVGEALAAYGATLGAPASATKANGKAFDGESSLRAYERTRVGFALAQVGDLRALPGLIERLGLDPTVVHAAERFWESDAGGHLSRTDNLRVSSARMLAELVDANPRAPASTWIDAERAVFAWVDQKPQPHTNAMRFLSRVRSERGLRALRKWAFPPDPIPKEGAMPPFPRAFEIAQSALTFLAAADPQAESRVVGQLTRKPVDFDGSMGALMSGGAAMRGMVLRALGYGAAAGLAHAREAASIDALWKVARDPKTHEEVRLTASEALGSIGELALLQRALTEAVAHSAGVTPEDALMSELMFTMVQQAAQPKLASDLLTLLERAPSGPAAVGASLALSLTPLEEADRIRLVGVLGRAPAHAEALCAALWATDVDAAVLAQQHAKLSAAELTTFDDRLFRTTSWAGRDARAPERIARWAQRARAFARSSKSDKAESALRAGLENISPSGPDWTRTGLRRALIALARTGDQGAVIALANWPEPGPLLALAAGGDGVPPAIVDAARAELAARGR